MSQEATRKKALQETIQHFNNILDSKVACYGFSTFSKEKRHQAEVTQALAMGK